MRYSVIAAFRARDGRMYHIGDVIECDAARAAQLRRRRLIGRRLRDERPAPQPEPLKLVEVEPPAAQDEDFAEVTPGLMGDMPRDTAESPGPTPVKGEELPTEPKHVGGGWYLMPDGSKVKGREAAERASAGELK